MWTSNFLMGNGHTSHCDRFAGHIWRSKWYIKPPTLLCFCSIYIIYECSHGLQVGDSCFGVLQFLTLSQDRSGLVSTHIQLSSPVTGLDRPRGFQEVKVPIFHDNGTGWWQVVSLMYRPPLPLGNTPGTHFCQRLSRPQSHRTIGRILCQ